MIDSMFINSDLHSVNEAYFGKSPRLVEIERNIKAIRSKFGTGNSLIGGAGLGGAVEQSAEWKRIRTLIEEQFGFYSVSLLCVRDAQLNACTYPIREYFYFGDNKNSKDNFADYSMSETLENDNVTWK